MDIKFNKIYPTDLTDTQWNTIVHLLDDSRKRKHSLHEIWNAIFYLLKTGCQWRMLPREYPKWELVYYYYNRWHNDGTIEEVHEVLRNKIRKRIAR